MTSGTLNSADSAKSTASDTADKRDSNPLSEDMPFRPAWWLPGGHGQTLWRKFSPAPDLRHRRQRIELSDGDFIDLDWALEAGWGAHASDTIAFILHGLAGCSRSPYVLSMQHLLMSHGISSVAMNFRGCSGEINRLARAYHSGVSDDLEEVFARLSGELPDRQFVLIGSSLGANVLLKWLGEQGEHRQVAGAVAVSTPFDLAACSRAMLRGMSRLYGGYFTRRLVADFQLKQRHFEQLELVEQARVLAALGDIQRVRTIWEFDDVVTAPLHGFRDAEDYYRQCSSARYLAAIATPTLLIQSNNDPLIPGAVNPDPASLPDNVQLLKTRGGGHVGFIAGAGNRWLENRILRFIKA